MISLPDTLPDDPALLKQLLSQMQNKLVYLEEQNALLRQRLFGRKSEQSADAGTPQLALFNEPESEPLLAVVDDADEEVVVPNKRRGKRKPLSADLPRVDIVHDLPEHELTCDAGAANM